MARRTFGWIQNPGSLATLRKVVASLVQGTFEQQDLIQNKLPLLLNNGLISASDYHTFISALSNINYPYDLLKGKSAKIRKNALCTGLVQSIIDAQGFRMLTDNTGVVVKMKKPYTDDWTADGYIRWGVSVGFLEYDDEKDMCKVSDSGIALSQTIIGSPAEAELLGDALLSYPPALKVLKIISSQTGTSFTKFEIGSQLGFKGEMGFTSIPQEEFVANYKEAPTKDEAKKIKNNMEGDSDKYARMIASWLSQLGWVKDSKKSVTESFLGNTYTMDIGQSYMITVSGLQAIKKADGYSSHPRMPRRVCFQMLASKAPGVDFLRKRRALILESLSSSPKTVENIQKYLESNGIKTGVDTIKDDIVGLGNIGLSLTVKDDKYKLEDTIIGLKIPKENITADNIIELKDKIAEKLKHIDHKYLILVDYAYSNNEKGKKNADARQFEIETANLFTKELGFKGERLGDSDKPDVIVYYEKNGTIIDNKSYKNGFSVDRHCSDEMQRYIIQNKNRNPNVPPNEWWKKFDAGVTNFTFLFITSKLVGNYKKNLTELSINTGVNGGAIGVDNLLYLSDKLKGNNINYNDFFDLMQNDEITIAI